MRQWGKNKLKVKGTIAVSNDGKKKALVEEKSHNFFFL